MEILVRLIVNRHFKVIWGLSRHPPLFNGDGTWDVAESGTNKEDGALPGSGREQFGQLQCPKILQPLHKMKGGL